MRLRTKRQLPRISTVDTLRGVIAAGLTSGFAMALTLGTSEQRMKLYLVSRIQPEDEDFEKMEKLAKNYRKAIRLVNTETVRGRL